MSEQSVQYIKADNDDDVASTITEISKLMERHSVKAKGQIVSALVRATISQQDAFISDLTRALEQSKKDREGTINQLSQLLNQV